MISFLKTLLGIHGQKAVRSMTDELVRLDPRAASQAQLTEMERDLDKAGKLIGQLRLDAQRERREAEEIQARYDRLLRAAEHLNGQYALEDDATKRAAMEGSLARLVTDLEKLAGDVQVEAREADEAESLLAEAEAAYGEKAVALREAKGTLDRAAADMQRAQIQRQRAEAQAERAAEIAGLRTASTSSLNAAVSAMRRQADEARVAADTARLKAQALGRAETGSEADPLIAGALAATAGRPAIGDMGARLAALRGPTQGAGAKALAAPTRDPA